ncbi:MAG: 50S ribosomal protein L4 [Candidatus Dependentiae bacterium]|nr:50S ribosomal protein L4 [Candidatus Dependentiae bacterium]
MAKQKVTKTTQATSNSALKHDTLSVKEAGLPATNERASQVGFSIWVRALLQNWRQGTVGCKDRSEVAFSNKKPWKQKGTGRARAGSARSPLWRKGGVCFGPQPRVRTLKVTKSLKKNVLSDIAFNQLNAGRVAYLDWTLSDNRPQTNLAYTLLKNAGLVDGKVTVFMPVGDLLTYSSFANISNVRILFYDQANAFDLVQGTRWVVFKRDLDHFKGMVGKWI